MAEIQSEPNTLAVACGTAKGTDMEQAKAVESVLPNVFRWEAYSSEHKVELTSHAVNADGKLYVFDPIPLDSIAMADLWSRGTPTAIVITNDNHQRDALTWATQWQVPIWASADTGLQLAGMHHFRPGETDWEGPWKLETLPGGSKGEVAFRWPEESLVIVGDAVTNLKLQGFALLPEKYSQDQNRLKQSLRSLAGNPFEYLLLGHGLPLLGGASKQIEQLVG
jgi:glyoxylase-like metal-dependent hydrolase (beta-lactamase superfamily II)